MEKTRVLNIDALTIRKQELLEGLDRNIAGLGSFAFLIWVSKVSKI